MRRQRVLKLLTGRSKEIGDGPEISWVIGVELIMSMMSREMAGRQFMMSLDGMGSTV